MNMKRLMIALVAGAWYAVGAFAQSVPHISLKQAFEQVAALDGFQPFGMEDMDGDAKAALGECKGTVHANSSRRGEVLDILSALPDSVLYSEDVSAKGKITRFYIATDERGVSSMLYAFVGLGGNDLLVLLYEGGDLAKYQEQADKIK